MKIPRKLKKGWNNLFWTKHQILLRLRMIDYTEAHTKIDGSYLGPGLYVTFEMERKFLHERLKHPYPVTKWTRKAEHIYK